MARLLNTDRPERVTRVMRANSAITAGEPVCLSIDGTDDGVAVDSAAVKAAATSAAVAAQLLVGVAVQDMAAGDSAEIIVSGYVPNLKVSQGSRAASTASYATAAAVAIGDQLGIDTSVDAFLRVTAAATGDRAQMIALGTLASIASAASTTSDTSTARTSTIPAWFNQA